MERGRELNQALKESFLRFVRLQPNLFPNFVCFEKLPGIKENDSVVKLVLLRIEWV